MTPLADFLLARIAEDEESAKRAGWGYGSEWRSETDEVEDWSVVHADGERDMVGCEDGDVTRHIARHDPARVLAECEAKRRIVSRCDMVLRGREAGMFNEGQATDARDNLRALALPYADHPDYDESWRP